MEMLSAAAREKGISDDELGTINAIVMLVSAGRVFKQYEEVCEELGTSTKTKACCQ